MAAWSATIISATCRPTFSCCAISARSRAPLMRRSLPPRIPTLMGMDSWNELMNPRDLSKLFDTPEYAAWKSLRDSDDAKYVGLCMPRVLARLPYGAKTEPVDEFAFEEDTDGHKGEKYAWMNAAYAMAANINRAFKEYGWCARIRGVQSGGEVEDLPAHTFPTDDGGVDLKCPTEIAITDRREAELAKSGLIPLIHRKNTDRAAFIGAQSLFKPKAYQNNPEATASSNLPRACLTCSRAAASPIISRSWSATRSAPITRRSSCKMADQLDQRICRCRSRRTPPKPPSAGGRWRARRSRSWRTRKIRDIIRPRSSCGPISSWKGWISAFAWCRNCRSPSKVMNHC